MNSYLQEQFTPKLNAGISPPLSGTRFFPLSVAKFHKELKDYVKYNRTKWQLNSAFSKSWSS